MAKKTVVVFLCGVIVFMYDLSCRANTEAGKTAIDVYSKYQLKPLNYGDVKLHGDLKRQFDEVCDYYYKIPNDDLLKPFRERAGLAAPGEDMGGVYVEHGPFGQFLAGYARIYAATKDEKYRIKAVYLMEEWAKTIEPNGFFFPSRSNRNILYAYQYEKILGGLLDIYYFCGDANALKYIDKITSWEEKNITKTKAYGCAVGGAPGEWYTQSENLYRAYLYTGNEYYKNFAEVWEYNEFWDEILGGKYDEMYKKAGHHAYSHVNSFNGLAGAYIVKGQEKYLDTLKKAYDFMQNEQCYATGGFGPTENLPPRKELVRSLTMTENHFETQCGSWAGFKMTKYLVGLTGDAKYADWTEKLIINGIGASIPMSAKGNVFYYSAYGTLGSEKKNIEAAWPCCSGTRVEAVPDYHNLIYFYDSNSIYVSQFFASEGSFRMGNSSVKILQETKFPEEDTARLTINIDKPAKFDIKFRIPKWLASKAAAEVNGKIYDYKVDNNWGIISNDWKSGDTIKIKLPMKFEISRLDGTKEYPAAIMYGPVALAVKYVESVGNPAAVIDLNNVSKDFVPSETEPMTWKMRGRESVVLKPFYAYKEGEKYFLYLYKNVRLISVSEDSKEISATLTNPQQDAGLSLLESHRDSENEPVVKSGRAAWAGTQTFGSKTCLMYYLVEFPGFKNGKSPKVTFSVDYFDEGTGNFRIVYDSSDESVKVVETDPGAWKEAGKFQLTDTKTWKTYECTVLDAKFAGRCNGSDFRFEINSGDAKPAVSMVKLTR